MSEYAVGSEIEVSDDGTFVLNDTVVSTEDVLRELNNQHPDLFGELQPLVNWQKEIANSNKRAGGLFERDVYVTPKSIFDQFKTSKIAVENDDVVSGVLESTESLALSDVRMDSLDTDQENVWNQIAYEIDLRSRIREMWRELFTVSQCYYGVMWGNKSFKVTGRTRNGSLRKKKVSDLTVPIGITILDPLKVIPVGNFMFRKEKLVYVANEGEAEDINAVLAGANTSDLVVKQFFTGKYTPTPSEKSLINEVLGSNTRIMDNMFVLNPNNVFRHTATRPDYERFANVRLKSVFELLDIKHQLRQMDRAHLLAGTNFIVLVKKGTDSLPATQSEINSLASRVRTLARVPLIVGDHRLDVEIVTPKMDMTLMPEKYNTIDARITARLYQMFLTGNYAVGASGDDSLKLARVAARGMEARRKGILQSLMRNVIRPTYMVNDWFEDEPEIIVSPRQVALEFDPNVMTFMMDLRDRGDISRETLLNEVDIQQEIEARRREQEDEDYKDVFTPTNVPFGAAGRAGGGNTGGGGTNRNSIRSGPARGPADELNQNEPIE